LVKIDHFRSAVLERCVAGDVVFEVRDEAGGEWCGFEEEVGGAGAKVAEFVGVVGGY
jgi:hypothetical protein